SSARASGRSAASSADSVDFPLPGAPFSSIRVGADGCRSISGLRDDEDEGAVVFGAGAQSGMGIAPLADAEGDRRGDAGVRLAAPRIRGADRAVVRISRAAVRRSGAHTVTVATRASGVS